MDTIVNEVIFEREFESENNSKITPLDYTDIMTEFLNSGYYKNSGLNIDRFLEEDKTIDLEKLELAIILAIEFEEFSNKSDEPVHIYLRNMNRYFELRGVSMENLDKVTEEASFILNFCKTIADEEESLREIIIQFPRGQHES